MKLYIVKIMYVWDEQFTDVAVYTNQKTALHDVLADDCIQDYRIVERELEFLPMFKRPEDWLKDPKDWPLDTDEHKEAS